MSKFLRFEVTSQQMIDDLLKFVEEHCADATQDNYDNLEVGKKFKIFLTSTDVALNVIPLILAYGKPADFQSPRSLCEEHGQNFPELPLTLKMDVGWLEFSIPSTATALRSRKIRSIGDLVQHSQQELLEKGLTDLKLHDIKTRLAAYDLTLANDYEDSVT